jgi:hypothetical protein
MVGAYKIMLWVGWGLTFVLLVAWPLLALPAGVFSKSYYTFWVILSIIWGFAATVVSESGSCSPPALHPLPACLILATLPTYTAMRLAQLH